MLLLWGLWETGTARAAAVPGPRQERHNREPSEGEPSRGRSEAGSGVGKPPFWDPASELSAASDKPCGLEQGA